MELTIKILAVLFALEACLALSSLAASSEISPVSNSNTTPTRPNGKIKRTIRVREVQPAENPQPAQTDAPQEAAQASQAPVSVHNEGPTNQIEVKPEISVSTQQQGDPKKETEEAESKSHEIPEKNLQLVSVEPAKEPQPKQTNIANVIDNADNLQLNQLSNSNNQLSRLVNSANNQMNDLVSNSGNSVSNLASDINNTKQTSITNMGNTETVHIDGVGNSKVTKVSNSGNSDTLEQELSSNVSTRKPTVVSTSEPSKLADISAGFPLIQVNFNQNTVPELAEPRQPRMSWLPAPAALPLPAPAGGQVWSGANLAKWPSLPASRQDWPPIVQAGAAYAPDQTNQVVWAAPGQQSWPLVPMQTQPLNLGLGPMLLQPYLPYSLVGAVPSYYDWSKLPPLPPPPAVAPKRLFKPEPKPKRFREPKLIFNEPVHEGGLLKIPDVVREPTTTTTEAPVTTTEAPAPPKGEEEEEAEEIEYEMIKVPKRRVKKRKLPLV